MMEVSISCFGWWIHVYTMAKPIKMNSGNLYILFCVACTPIIFEN